jgi:ethanolamine utilization microcompartment shell protein EutS
MVEALKANVEVEKTRILTFIGKSGPIVSNTIAKSLNLNSFLTSALLSELFNEKKLNASTIRVGGSALYYLNGQEEQLERFTGFLGHKEKEAYDLLKKQGVLQDKLLEPAIRVAIRGVKDFAIPLSVKRGDEEILFWKFRFFADSDNKIRDLLKDELKIKEEVKGKIVEVQAAEEIESPKEIKERKKKVTSCSDKILEKWTAENKVTVRELILAKGKDAKARVAVKSEIGEIDFLLVLKNKKSISESDLAIAYQEGLNLKLPVIFLTSGKLSKATKQYLEGLGQNLILRKI